MYVRYLAYACSALLFSSAAAAQPVKRIEPANWWAGMQHPQLQLLVYGKDIARLTPTLNYDGVSVTGVERTANPNYLFVNLSLAADVQPGDIALHFSLNGETVLSHTYPLLQRRAARDVQQPLWLRQAHVQHRFS